MARARAEPTAANVKEPEGLNSRHPRTARRKADAKCPSSRREKRAMARTTSLQSYVKDLHPTGIPRVQRQDGAFIFGRRSTRELLEEARREAVFDCSEGPRRGIAFDDAAPDAGGRSVQMLVALPANGRIPLSGVTSGCSRHSAERYNEDDGGRIAGLDRRSRTRSIPGPAAYNTSTGRAHRLDGAKMADVSPHSEQTTGRRRAGFIRPAGSWGRCLD